jgi:hypothetical protein
VNPPEVYPPPEGGQAPDSTFCGRVPKEWIPVSTGMTGRRGFLT